MCRSMTHQRFLSAYLSGFRFTSRRVHKSIRTLVSFTLRTLIYVYSLEIHFYNRNRRVSKRRISLIEF